MTRPLPGSIPDAPGSYQFIDAHGRVIYVGKAKSLRQRLSSYFQDPAGLGPRTAQMVSQADHVEWVVVDSESEALFLEHSLIQQFQPRYNVRLKDDKSYPWLALTVNDEWPRPAVVRGRKRTGVRYFGPYPNTGAIRETLDLLLRSFPVRTCSDTKLKRHQRLGRPCLMFHIERCSGPCVGAVDHADYDRMVADLISFLGGDTAALERDLVATMKQASDALEFERASVLRDKLEAVRAADAVRQMELERPEDLDVFGLSGDELEAAVQVFHVRSGKVVGRSALFVDKAEDLTPAELMERILVDVYADPVSGVPRQVLVPTMPADADAVTDVPRGPAPGPRGPPGAGEGAEAGPAPDGGEQRRRGLHPSSAAPHLRPQQPGAGPRVPATGAAAPGRPPPHRVLRHEPPAGHRLRGVDGGLRGRAAQEERLPPFPGGDRARQRRLCRHGGGADPAADLPPGRRRVDGPGSANGSGAASARGQARRRFAYPPQLLLLDGGLGQLNVGIRVLESLGLSERIPIAALAKSFEEIYRPGSSEPIRLSRQSDGLYLLQRLRDEAHRFAISYHRTLRGKRMTAGALDQVGGLGPKRRSRLIDEFGGLAALRKASKEELLGLSWLPAEVGAAVFDRLHTPMTPDGPADRNAKVDR